MSSLTPNSSCSLRKQHCKLALKELVSGHVPSPCRFWKWLLQSQSCPGGQSRTYVRVRMQRAESRMSHTLMYDVDTVNTSPVWLQYLMETTLFGCPLREAISWPVTRFHILQLRSVGRRTCPRALEVSPPRAQCPGDNTPSEPLPPPTGPEERSQPAPARGQDRDHPSNGQHFPACSHSICILPAPVPITHLWTQ